MSKTPRYECHTHGCTRMIPNATHCCRPCMRSDGVRHALTCSGTPRTGGPSGGSPRKG